MATEKLSLTLDEELVAEAREAAGARGLSGYVNPALRQQLQRDRLTAYLAELENEHGPVDSKTREAVRQAWQDPRSAGSRRRSA